MSDSAPRPLAVGLKYSRTVTVTDDMTPAHLRHEPIRVLSTPDMIRLIEQTAIEAVQPDLADGQATVGTRVDVAHLAATPVGMTVTITVELTEIDRRRLGFRVEVRDELDEAGRGHARALHRRRRAAAAATSGQDEPVEGRRREASMTTLSDRVAIVTGAGHGIGHAIAVALATAGADVAAVDIDKAGGREDGRRRGRGRPARASTLADRRRRRGQHRSDGAARSPTTFGRIDVLVNNAGVTRRAYIMDLTEADWDRIMRVNGKGVFFCLQRVAREMIPRRSGVIVNIASIAGKGYAGTSNAIYAGSKGAVIGMTRIAALQLARHNINVNAICPGSTVTALSNDNLKSRAQGGGRQRRGDGAAPQRRHPARPRQRPGGHRGHGRVPRLAGRPQHHRAVLQRRRRHHPRLSRGGQGMARKKRPGAKKKRRAKPAASRNLAARSPKATRLKAGVTTARENDDVLVAFEHGATRAPYVVGNLWSGSDRPPSQGRSAARPLPSGQDVRRRVRLAE